jgi:hypothetical protein
LSRCGRASLLRFTFINVFLLISPGKSRLPRGQPSQNGPRNQDMRPTPDQTPLRRELHRGPFPTRYRQKQGVHPASGRLHCERSESFRFDPSTK